MLIQTKILLDLNLILQQKFKQELSTFELRAVSNDVIGLITDKCAEKKIKIEVKNNPENSSGTTSKENFKNLWL
jgi:hypothetical protein